MNIEGISIHRAARYATVSVCTFFINLTIVWFCAQALGFHYLAAVLVGFVTETTLLYCFNRLWTFRGVANTTAIAGYARAWLVALSTLGLILTVEWFLVGMLGVHYLLARVLVAPVAYAWSLFWDGTFTFGVFRVTR